MLVIFLLELTLCEWEQVEDKGCESFGAPLHSPMRKSESCRKVTIVWTATVQKVRMLWKSWNNARKSESLWMFSIDSHYNWDTKKLQRKLNNFKSFNGIWKINATLNVDKLWNISKLEWSLWGDKLWNVLKKFENVGLFLHSVHCFNGEKMAENVWISLKLSMISLIKIEATMSWLRRIVWCLNGVSM